MNRFNFLKYVQHFDALDTNQKEEKKKKQKIFSLQLFGTLQHYEKFRQHKLSGSRYEAAEL